MKFLLQTNVNPPAPTTLSLTPETEAESIQVEDLWRKLEFHKVPCILTAAIPTVLKITIQA